MWKTNIKSVVRDEGKSDIAKVTFEYVHTDGRKHEVTERVSEPSSIKTIAQNAMRELQRKDDIENLISNPTLGEIVFSTPPTQEELDKAAYIQQVEELRLLKEQVSLGLVTETEYQAKLTEVKVTEPTKK